MKYLSVLYFLCFILISCSETENEKVKTNNESSKEEIKSKIHPDISTDSLWRLLIEGGGCLTGGQYVYEGRFGGEGCVMSNSENWKLFFNRDSKELISFLITKLDKTDTTWIHTCPFQKTLEGELAIYAMQNITKKNFYGHPTMDSILKSYPKDDYDHQHQLWEILRSEKNRLILADFFTKSVKK